MRPVVFWTAGFCFIHMSSFRYEFASIVIVEAAFFGDKPTAAKYGISPRTIHRYRKRLNEDAQLSALVKIKKDLMEQEWAKDMPAAIRASIEFLRKAANNAKTDDPDAIHAVAGALKILSEVALTKRVIDARLIGSDRQANEAA